MVQLSRGLSGSLLAQRRRQIYAKETQESQCASTLSSSKTTISDDDTRTRRSLVAPHLLRSTRGRGGQKAEKRAGEGWGEAQEGAEAEEGERERRERRRNQRQFPPLVSVLRRVDQQPYLITSACTCTTALDKMMHHHFSDKMMQHHFSDKMMQHHFSCRQIN